MWSVRGCCPNWGRRDWPGCRVRRPAPRPWECASGRRCRGGAGPPWPPRSCRPSSVSCSTEPRTRWSPTRRASRSGEAIGLGAERRASAQAGPRSVRELGHVRGGYDALQRGRAPFGWRDDQAGRRGLGDGAPARTAGGRRPRSGSGRVSAFRRGAGTRPAHAAGGSLLNARSIAPRSSRAARATRRGRGSGNAPRRSDAHPPQPELGFSPASHRPSRRRERWIVRWPD